MSRWADEVNGAGVVAVAAALGLTVRDRSVTNTSVSPCPACHAERRSTRDPNPRGPIGLRADGRGWRCHRCQVTGDAVTLAALVIHDGTVPSPHDPAGWRIVETACAHVGLCTSETAPGRPATARSASPPPVPLPTPPPAPQRPPAAAVRALWDRCVPVTEDAAVRAWLEGRRLDPALVADRQLARALPLAGPLPAWCQYGGASWRVSTHRVIVPLYGLGGRLESLHARAVAPATPNDKAASPRGAEIRGLVMADAGGRALLAGAAPPGPGRVIVAEGVPDFLTWATHYGDAAEDAPPVFGVISGSWTSESEIATTIPRGWTVIIRTHADKDGDKYAERIRASLAGRCVCRRPRSQVSTYPRMGVDQHARR